MAMSDYEAKNRILIHDTTLGEHLKECAQQQKRVISGQSVGCDDVIGQKRRPSFSTTGTVSPDALATNCQQRNARGRAEPDLLRAE